MSKSIEKLTHFASAHGFNVKFDEDSDGDFFYPTSKRIVIKNDDREDEPTTGEMQPTPRFNLEENADINLETCTKDLFPPEWNVL